MLALREIANNSKHFISREFDRFTSSVEAYDFLMTKMSPATADPTASNTDGIERLTNLKLISVKQGGFMKFLSLFQEAVFDLEETGAFVPSPEYQKSLLISKLSSEYHSMTIPSATKVDWDKYVADLIAFSVAIEKKDTKSYKDALNSNVNSDRSGKKLVDSILGIPITDKGFVPTEFWSNMFEDKKTEFFTKKRSLIDDDNFAFKINAKCKEDKKTKYKSSKVSDNKKLQHQVKSLKKDLKSKMKKGSKSKSKSKKDNDSDDDSSDEKESKVNNMSLMFPKMSKENQKKVLKFCKKQVAVIWMVSANIPSFRKVQLVESRDGMKSTVVDCGSYTGLKGDAYIFMEHTHRRANVVGFDQDLTKTNLPIGSCVTAALDSNGDTVIFLENEQIDHSSQSNFMISPNQLRAFGVDIDDCPSCFEVGGRTGRQSMKVGEHEIPFQYVEGIILLKTRAPTIKELNDCPILILTSDATWNPNEDQGLTEIWDPDNTIEKEIQDLTARDAVASRVRNGKNVHICNVGTSDKVVTWTPDAFQDGEKELVVLDECDELPAITSRPTGSISSGHNSRASSEPRCLIDFNDDDSADLSISSSDSDSSDGSIPDLDYGSNSDDDSDSDDESMPGLLTRHGADSDDKSSDDDSDDESDKDDEPTLDSGEKLEWKVKDTSEAFYHLSIEDESIALSFDSCCSGSLTFSRNGATEMATTYRQAFNNLATSKDKVQGPAIEADADTVLAFVARTAKIHVKKNVHLGPKKATITPQDWEKMRRCLGHLPMEVVQKTFDITTQLAKVDIRLALRRHYKSRFPGTNVN